MEIMDVTETHNEKAEKLNGLAMLGVMAALGAAITGQIIPGLVMPMVNGKKYPYTKLV